MFLETYEFITSFQKHQNLIKYLKSGLKKLCQLIPVLKNVNNNNNVNIKRFYKRIDQRKIIIDQVYEFKRKLKNNFQQIFEHF